MPQCRDPELIRPLLEARRPATNSVFNLVYGIAGAKARWVRVDSLDRPRAVLCRTRSFTLYAADRQAASRVLAEVPRNYRLQFGATPTRLVELVKRNWHGPDTGWKTWLNPCYLYVLDPDRLVVARGRRVSPLTRRDAPVVARYWPYGKSVRYVTSRILACPNCGIRRGHKLVAWGLTHDDGSMGFLHVLEEYRGQGMARLLTTALAQRLLAFGIRPFMYIVRGNEASIRLTEGMGFERAGEFSWFGTG